MNHDLAIPGPETVASEPGEFNLGTWLGRRQAFGLMAGKAAAADVDCLRQIRDTRMYKSKCFDAIAPHLTDEGLTLDGETFALHADNSRQVAARRGTAQARGSRTGEEPQPNPGGALRGLDPPRRQYRVGARWR